MQKNVAAKIFCVILKKKSKWCFKIIIMNNYKPQKKNVVFKTVTLKFD